MLTRIDDFFEFLEICKRDRDVGIRVAARAAIRAQGMTDFKDYQALAAIALHYRPRRIFEIGTYLGVTSDFFLTLLPECEVVSIAYTKPKEETPGQRYNNSELSSEQIGSEISGTSRIRFRQLYGDSHKLKSRSLTSEYGQFDLVFIDGDHSAQGVRMDTELAKEIISQSGVICWHDANPKPKYMAVRQFLEEELSLQAIATKDEYIGGIAAWSKTIEEELSLKPDAS